MGFLSRPEKRNNLRVDAELDVDILIEGKRMSATSSNISCGGMFIPIKKHLMRERTDLEITLHLPDYNKPVKVIGEVARLQDGSLFKGQPAGVAIQFRGLYDDNILAIDRYIKNKVH